MRSSFRWLCGSVAVAGGLLGFFSLMVAPATAQEAGSTGQAPGIVFETLSSENLDDIEKETGYRVGVLVADVKSGSAGEAAGIKPGDIIITIGETGVDSAEAAVAAIEDTSGVVEVMAFTRSEEGYEGTTYSLDLSGEFPGGPVPSEPTEVEGDLGAAVTAYFDMMDFIRTEAWGRRVVTSGEERQRVSGLLQQGWGEMDPSAQGAIQQLPQTWAGLQKAWNEASQAKKGEQRDYWRKQLLVPAQLFIPPEEHETFRGSNDRVVFDYPKDWILAQTEAEGTQYLYLGPPGTEATWDQVVNPSTSPPGALFVVMPIDEEMKSLNTYLDGARFIAERFVTAGAPDFKEIDALELGQDGAIITLLGRFPGEKEDKFFWVGSVRYGPDYVFIGRLGGPTSQQETLVPAFGNALTTMELNPPGGGNDYGSAMVDYYAAKAGSIATSGPW